MPASLNLRTHNYLIHHHDQLLFSITVIQQLFSFISLLLYFFCIFTHLNVYQIKLFIYFFFVFKSSCLTLYTEPTQTVEFAISLALLENQDFIVCMEATCLDGSDDSSSNFVRL